MQPTSFRAYALKPAIRNRAISGGPERETVESTAEEVVAEGKLKGGVASFDAGSDSITQVVFYGGSGDEAVVLGRLLGPLGPGPVEANFADIPDEEPAPDTITVGGVEYKKAG